MMCIHCGTGEDGDCQCDEIDRLRSEIARLRKTADGQIRSRVAEDIAVESAWERCGITPHWPDDEAGSIVSHAESMAMEIARLREERRWVPVGERLPKPGETVLMLMDGLDPASGWYENGHFHNAYDTPYVTHWMPLPPGPEGDG